VVYEQLIKRGFTLKLPKHLRMDLSVPFGELVQERELVSKLNVRKDGRVIAVGDRTTQTLLKYGIEPDLAIFDFKTKRKRIYVRDIKEHYKNHRTVTNPAGEITFDLFKAIEIALILHKKIGIRVEGEEDLATLPCVYFAADGDKIVYGIPNKGLNITTVDKAIKEKSRGVLSKMRLIKNTGVKMHGTAIISDFDDTLFLTDDAIRETSRSMLGKALSRKEVRKLPRSIKSRIYYEAFSKNMDLLIPNLKLIKLYRRYAAKGYDIIVLSARGMDLLNHTINMLKGSNVPYKKLLLRKDLNSKDQEWKLEMINDIADRYKRLIAFEDKEDNLKLFASALRGDNIEYFLVKRNAISRYRN
jgi:uncharacterized protein (UPF0218 family)